MTKSSRSINRPIICHPARYCWNLSQKVCLCDVFSITSNQIDSKLLPALHVKGARYFTFLSDTLQSTYVTSIHQVLLKACMESSNCFHRPKREHWLKPLAVNFSILSSVAEMRCNSPSNKLHRVGLSFVSTTHLVHWNYFPFLHFKEIWQLHNTNAFKFSPQILKRCATQT